MDLTPAPAAHRISLMDGLLSSPAAEGVQLAVFPELSVTGYDLSAANAGKAEALDGPSVAALCELARRHDAILVAGMTEDRDGRCHNTQVVVGPDGLCGVYRKRHVSSAENAIWQCGGGNEIIETDLGRIGIGICADMLFGTPWSRYDHETVDLIISAAAWPDFRSSKGVPVRAGSAAFHNRYPIAFAERLSARARVPVVFSDGCGPFESRLPVFGTSLSWRASGHSRIVVGGRTVADDGGEATEQIVTADVPLGRPADPVDLPVMRPSLGDRLRHKELLVGEVTTAWLFRVLRVLRIA